MTMTTPTKPKITAAHRHHLPVRAALTLAAAILCFSGQDVALKWLSADYGIAQSLFFDRILAVPLALWLAFRAGTLAQVRTQRPFRHLLRAGCTISDMTMFVASISLMLLADTITIGFAAPLIMTVLSLLLLKERVGPRRPGVRWSVVEASSRGAVESMGALLPGPDP